jgi:drug/metabolite transporter (DMT)-like permease
LNRPQRLLARSETVTGALAAATAACLFGTSFVATVFLLRSFSPLSGAFWRAGLGWVALVSFMALTSFRRRPDGVGAADRSPKFSSVARLWRSAVIGVLGGPIFLVGLNLSVAGMGATITSFVLGISVVLAAVLATFILGEPLTPLHIAGFVLALAGTFLLAKLRTASSLGGIAPGLVAATSYAFFLVLGRRWSRPYRLAPQSLTLSAITLTVVGLFLWLGATHSEIIPPHVRFDALMALVWLALVLVVGQTLLVASLRRLPGRHSSAFLLLNPVTAAVLGATILGESLDRTQILGAFLVLAGMAFATGLVDLLRRRFVQS